MAFHSYRSGNGVLCYSLCKILSLHIPPFLSAPPAIAGASPKFDMNILVVNHLTAVGFGVAGWGLSLRKILPFHVLPLFFGQVHERGQGRVHFLNLLGHALGDLADGEMGVGGGAQRAEVIGAA